MKEFWKPIDLDLHEADAREALETVFRRYGEPLTLRGPIEPRRVTLQIKNASFWEAVERICKAHSKVRIALRPSEIGFALANKPWIPSPVSCDGPFRFSIYDVVRVREIRYPDRLDRTDVTVALQWLSALPLDTDSRGHAGALRVMRAEDDLGNSMLPTIETGGEFESALEMNRTQCGWILHLQPAARAASKISVLEMEWEGAVFTDIEELTIDNPLKSVGRSWKVGNVSLILKQFSRREIRLPNLELYDYAFTISFDPNRVPQEWRSALKQVPLSRRLLSDVRAGRLEDRSLIWSTEGGTSAKRWGTIWGKPAPLSVRVAGNIRPLKIKVLLKDVPLPENDR